MESDHKNSKKANKQDKVISLSTHSVMVQKDCCKSFSEPSISGKESDNVVDRFIFTFKDLKSNNDLEINITSDTPIIKLHFSLKGNYSYRCCTNNNIETIIPEGYFNIFSLPKMNGKEYFESGDIQTIEIYLTGEDLKKNLGDSSTDALLEWYSAIEENEPYVFHKKSKPITLKTRNQLNDIIHCSYTGTTKEIFLRSRLSILLIDLLIEKPKIKEVKESLPEHDYQAILKVEDYCKNNLKKKLSIADLSIIAGYNTTKLKYNFKKVFKTTIFKHITHLRMERARHLIQEEGCSVAEAAYKVGYSNPQHFTTAFKKNMGYLPSQITKRG